MIRSIVFAASASLILPAAAMAEPKPFVMDSNHSTIHARWTHTTGTPLLIAFPEYESEIMFDADNIENSSVTVTVDTASAWTGSEVWDDHLTGDERPLLRSAEFPTATFTSTQITRTGENTAELTGNLTIKDQTHPVTFDVELMGENSGGNGMTYGLTATTVVDRTIFDLSMASEMMGSDLEIVIATEIQEQTGE